MPLRLTHEMSGVCAVVATDGELDLVTGPRLAEVAIALIDNGAHDVIIDARGLTFCDSSGLTAFVRIANRLGDRPGPTATDRTAPQQAATDRTAPADSDRPGQLAIAGARSIVRRVLEVSGLDEAFLVVDEVSDAITALKI
jgi:anti-sigma B factor antagonist